MPLFTVVFDAMASRGEVRLDAADEATARAVAKLAIAEVHRIEYKYSRYRPDSIVSRVNAAAGRSWTECDDETLSLLNFADQMFRVSDGLFDITSGVLRKAWDFRRAVVPEHSVLKPLLELIGWDRVEREEKRIRLPAAGMELDFGGFGKEYAADRAAALLSAQGVRHGYVNLAGDMRIIGPQPDGQPWSMGIQDPRHKQRMIATIPVSAGGLTTSGDYERFFERDGQRYCHILDPRSGQPVTYWRSISVLAPYCIAAGSLSTIAMLKQAEGKAFLDALATNYLAVDSAGNLMQKDADAEDAD